MKTINILNNGEASLQIFFHVPPTYT